MTEDNNPHGTIEGAEAKPKRKPRKKTEILTRCKVLKGYCLRDGEFTTLYNKNSEGHYITHKVETKSGAIRHERTVNVVELNLEDLKAALKLKAVEVVD